MGGTGRISGHYQDHVRRSHAKISLSLPPTPLMKRDGGITQLLSTEVLFVPELMEYLER